MSKHELDHLGAAVVAGIVKRVVPVSIDSRCVEPVTDDFRDLKCNVLPYKGRDLLCSRVVLDLLLGPVLGLNLDDYVDQILNQVE